MTMSNNVNLQDFSALSSLVIMVQQPSIIQQCCPSYDFFQAPYLFTRVNFPCQICTEFTSVNPLLGPLTGGTIIDLYFTGTSPNSFLLFYFASIPMSMPVSQDLTKIVNCSLNVKSN